MSESHGSTQEWQLAEELFLRALELEPAARTAFLAELPVADTVRLAVLKRLAGHDTSLMLSSLTPDLLRGAPGSLRQDGEAPWMALPAEAPYRVGDAIGRDAVADRFRARRSTDDTAVVLEFLPTGVPADLQAQEQLRTVVQRLRAVGHPQIGVPADCGDTDEGQLYLVREGDEGETLARRLRRMPPLSPEQRTQMIDTLRSALAAAHAVGVTHGQIRPEWVIVAADGTARLFGFGVEMIRGGASVTPDSDVVALNRLAELLQG